MLPSITSDLIKKTILHHLPSVEAIYLFGSQAKGNAQENSDIDLAILCSDVLSANIRWDLSQTLAVLLNKNIDLIDLKQTNTVMQWQVIHTGQRIFSKDASMIAFFETYVLADYIRLMELRQGIIDDIKKRGSIYADIPHKFRLN